MGMPLRKLIISDDVVEAPFSQRLIGDRAIFAFEAGGVEVITPDDQASCIRLLWSIDPQCSMLISGDDECIREAMTLGLTTVRYGDGFDAPDVILGLENIGPQDIICIYNHANMLPVSICRTERLLIRELSIQDTEELFEWRDCHYYAGSRYEPAETVDEFAVLHRRYIRNQYGFYGFGLWGMYLDGRLVGECGIVQLSEEGRAEIAYAVKPEFRGLGYAPEAVAKVMEIAEDRFDAEGCFARIARENRASRRVAEKCGLEIIEI